MVIFSGCPQKRGPADPTPAKTPVDSVLNITPADLHACSPGQSKIGLVLINSQAEYDAYLSVNLITPLTAPPVIDYAAKTLVGSVYTNITPDFAFKYDSIITDGTTTTINATLTQKYCPNPNIQYMEGCLSWFTIADKITTPAVLKVARVWVDCNGNTMSGPLGLMFVQATPIPAP